MKKADLLKVVVIGASHAAIECVLSLRKLDFQGEITVLSEEGCFPYQKPPLSKHYFSSEYSVEKLFIRSKDVYQQQNIDIKLNCQVARIHKLDKNVELTDGTLIAYDKLVLAVGARVRKLNVEGAEYPNIYYCRSKQHVDDIKQCLEQQSQRKQKLLIIGAGYIGLEVAASANNLGGTPRSHRRQFYLSHEVFRSSGF